MMDHTVAVVLTKRQLDSGTSEREIYDLLGLPWLTPHERQRWAR